MEELWCVMLLHLLLMEHWSLLPFLFRSFLVLEMVAVAAAVDEEAEEVVDKEVMPMAVDEEVVAMLVDMEVVADVGVVPIMLAPIQSMREVKPLQLLVFSLSPPWIMSMMK